MKISEVMTRNTVPCRLEDTLAFAAGRMWDCDVGCLPVINANEQVIGMITDRDICMAAYIQGRPLSEIPVSTAMSREVYFCGPEDRIKDAETTMRSRQVHRLPVLDSELKLLGMVSLNDFAREEEREVGSKITDITAQEVASTLAAIAHPRDRNTEVQTQ